MSTLSRKQREIQQREKLILDAAQDLLQRQGYNQLTMERIAETVEYSKGTIYNHFASKEDLICSLACRAINNLIDIFQLAYNYPGCTRERYSAIGIGYSLYNQLNPLDAQYLQIFKNKTVREKVSQARLAQVERLEQKITRIAKSIVQEAIDCGDLDRKYQEKISTIVFGCWSMHYGALLLEKSDIPLQQLGFSPVVTMLWDNTNVYLDGYRWRPLSTEVDADSWLTDISLALFADELRAQQCAGLTNRK